MRGFLFSCVAAVVITLPQRLHSEEHTQFVSFETTYTETAPGQAQALVRLTRVAPLEAQQASLSHPLKIQRLAGAGVETGASAYFPAGSTLGTCTVSLQSEETIALLSISKTPGVECFSRNQHVLRRKTFASTGATNLINAVIFSGAETPETAVEGSDNRPLVEGGIVALGGAPQPPALFPARLLPKPEYAMGEWTPPLNPQLLVIEIGPWKSSTAP